MWLACRMARRAGKIFHDIEGLRRGAMEHARVRYGFARRVRDLAVEFGGDKDLCEFAVALLSAAFDLSSSSSTPRRRRRTTSPSSCCATP